MITPTKGNLYIKRTETKEEKTSSGIIIPHTITDSQAHDRVLIYGEVLAIGESTNNYFEVGQTVTFPRYEGWPLNSNKSKDDVEFIVPERFIMAVVTDTCA